MTQNVKIPTRLTSVMVNNQKILFRLRQNKRIKSVRLVVSPEEGLVYETPLTPHKGHATKFILKNQKWVVDTLQKLKSKAKAAQNIKALSQSLLIFGKEKKIHIKLNKNRNSFLETSSQIHLHFKKDRIKKIEVEKTLEDWLKNRATRYLPLRLKSINQNQFTFNDLKIRNLKTLWGSCSAEKVITLNWRLILAPQFVIDYVIFHELSHTIHMNHSKKFWQLVERVYPNTQKAESWLKRFEWLLHVHIFND